jgi:hypothetical protein
MWMHRIISDVELALNVGSIRLDAVPSLQFRHAYKIITWVDIVSLSMSCALTLVPLLLAKGKFTQR